MIHSNQSLFSSNTGETSQYQMDIFEKGDTSTIL